MEWILDTQYNFYEQYGTAVWSLYVSRTIFFPWILKVKRFEEKLTCEAAFSDQLRPFKLLKFGLSEKHTKFEKIFLMVLTNQLIYLVNVKTMRKIFFKLCMLLKKSKLNLILFSIPEVVLHILSCNVWTEKHTWFGKIFLMILTITK